MKQNRIEKLKSKLEDSELEIWELTLELIDVSILEPVDYISLYDYCKVKNRYYVLFDEVGNLDNNGVVEINKGQPYQHPLISICNKIKEQCDKFEHKFGFSPNSRNIFGYEKKEKGKETKLSKLLKPGMKKLK